MFVPDIDNIFVNTAEFATVREFRISDGAGGFIVFNAPCVWDEDKAKSNPITNKFGVWMGSVACYIAAKYLPRPPVAGELIYSPANLPWEVIDITIAESMYEIMLGGNRSMPQTYGRN